MTTDVFGRRHGETAQDGFDPLVTHSGTEHGRAQASRRAKRVLVATDVVGALGALSLAWLIAQGGPPTELAAWWQFLGSLVAGASVILLVLSAAKLYRARVCALRSIETAGVGRAVLAAGVAVFVALELLGSPAGARIATGSVASAFVVLLTGRAGYRAWINGRRRSGALTWPIVLVGANEEAEAIRRLALDHPETGLSVRGVVGNRWQADTRLAGVPWLGDAVDAARAVRRTGATGAVVFASALSPAELNAAVRQLHRAGVHVHLSSGLSGIAHTRLRALPLAHEPLLYLESHRFGPWQLRTKRAIDLVVATLALLCTAPVWAILALAIKAQDGGPVFFRQERVGYGGSRFRLCKFRTMVVDAEERLEVLRARNQRAGPLFKLESDPRVTPLGRFMRRASLDELPQLLNVLRGEMSLVGPRPALPHEVEQFDEHLRQRDAAMPGISGLWQVEARDNPSFWAYERLDIFYVENWSVSLDLSIMLATVGVLVRRGLSGVRDLLPRSRRKPTPVSVLE